MPTQLETRVAVLERDVNSINNLYDKLDVSITKLTEVATAIKQLIAVHENKFENQQNTLNYAFKDIAAIKLELDQVKDVINNIKNDIDEKMDIVAESVHNFDRIKWILVGVAGVISFIFAHLNPMEYIKHLLSK